MSLLSQFTGSSTIPVNGMISFTPTAADVITSSGQTYQRAGKLSTYDSTVHSALIGTDLAQTTKYHPSGGSQKILYKGVYEYWTSVVIGTNSSPTTRNEYYRIDSNGNSQLMIRDPIFIDFTEATYAQTLSIDSKIGVMRSGTSDQLYVRFALYSVPNYGNTIVTQHLGAFTSPDGFTWAWLELSTVSAANTSATFPSVNNSHATAADSFCAVVITGGGSNQLAVFDYKMSNVYTILCGFAALIGPDGIMYTPDNSALNFYNALTRVDTTLSQFASQATPANSDVNEKVWVFGASSPIANYYMNVGSGTIISQGGTIPWGLGSSNPVTVTWNVYTQSWWASTGATTPSISYNASAAAFSGAMAFIGITSSVGATTVGNLANISNGYYGGTTFYRQSSTYTTTLATGGTIGTQVVFMGGLYYSYMASAGTGAGVAIFSSTDLNAWTYTGTTTGVTSNPLTVFKVVNNILFIGQGTTLYSTTDGITFTTSLMAGTTPVVYDIDFFSSTYIAVGSSTTNNTWRSATLGGTWTGALINGTANTNIVYRVVNNGTTQCVTSSASSSIYYSTNGTSYTTVASNVTNPFYIMYDGTRFVTMSKDSTQSATGTTGQAAFTLVTPTLQRTPFTTWTVSTNNYYNNLFNLVFMNSTYYLSSSVTTTAALTNLLGTCMFSTDLAAWNLFPLASPQPTPFVSVANGKLFLSGSNGVTNLGNRPGIIENAGTTPLTVGLKTPPAEPNASMFVRLI